MNRPTEVFPRWRSEARGVLDSGPVVPVIVVDGPDRALALAEALLAGGVRVLEITLRTDGALEAIAAVASSLPDALVGAGTVVSPDDYRRVVEAGGRFAISPGLTPELLETAVSGPVPLIPGVATVSELMAGMARGLESFKFFPAEAAGGRPMLEAISGPFPDVRFCPTGGIGPENFLSYLALDNVTCVGGSWLAPKDLVSKGDWREITALARKALAQVHSRQEG